jgi:hypothetical protein
MQCTIKRTPYIRGIIWQIGIYFGWTTYVKIISVPQGERENYLPRHQESTRKCVERAFGVPRSRFAIICGSTRAWHMETHKHAIYHACIILHNMIGEDGRYTYWCNFDYFYDNLDNNISTTKIINGPHLNLATKLQ